MSNMFGCKIDEYDIEKIHIIKHSFDVQMETSFIRTNKWNYHFNTSNICQIFTSEAVHRGKMSIFYKNSKVQRWNSMQAMLIAADNTETFVKFCSAFRINCRFLIPFPPLCNIFTLYTGEHAIRTQQAWPQSLWYSPAIPSPIEAQIFLQKLRLLCGFSFTVKFSFSQKFSVQNIMSMSQFVRSPPCIHMSGEDKRRLQFWQIRDTPTRSSNIRDILLLRHPPVS